MKDNFSADAQIYIFVLIKFTVFINLKIWKNKTNNKKHFFAKTKNQKLKNVKS